MGNIITFLKFLLFGLIPPDRPEGILTEDECRKYKKAKKRWAYFVAGSLWVGFFALLALLLPTYGLWSARFDRVAWGQDVDAKIKPVTDQVVSVVQQVSDVGKKTDRLLLGQLRAELYDTRRKQCRAIEARDAERMQELARAMQALQDEYVQYSHDKEPWPVPPCNEV